MVHDGTAARLNGILFLVIGVSLFGVVDGLSKVVIDTAGFWQIILARYALALPMLLATKAPSRWLPVFRTGRPGLQILRGLSPLMIGMAMVIGVQHLPLADATVILFAGPFIVVALSGPFLGERVASASWIGVVVGFLAVLIVTRPGFASFSIWMLAPLAGAVLYALFQLLTAALARASESADTTLAWTHLIGLAIALPMAVLEWQPLDGTTLALCALLSIVFGASHLFLARAFALAPANVLTPFTYTQIIAATAFGFFVFGEWPDQWTLLGIALMIVAGVWVVRKSA